VAILQAALNGDRRSDEHAELPLAGDELVLDAVACFVAGTREFHLHPRDASGAESLEPAVIDGVCRAVRVASGGDVRVGVSTGAWIEPDLARRLELIGGWSEPDYASVNVAEEGFALVMDALLRAGIGVEAGVASLEDAGRLAACGFADRLTRVLVEPIDPPIAQALAVVHEIHAALDDGGVTAPRLQHADGAAAWVVIEDAIAAGLDTRVGLEDTLLLPDGSPAPSNAALIVAARELGAGG
jgi:uncharacterized protein (DUF849 family)